MSEPIQIVIVGGGTAGWMTAAALVSHLGPKLCRVRLIESDEIGTVGVGEATLPQIRAFNQGVGLDEAEMMRRTQATFKLGIEFVDWGFTGASYIHPFGAYGRPMAGVAFHHHWLRAQGAGLKAPIGDFSFAVAAARSGRFGFPDPDPRSVGSTFDYAFHFDAGLYARQLRELSESRGVERTEGKILAVQQRPQNGDIASVTMESGDVMPGDFFIDCSGFRALLIGKPLVPHGRAGANGFHATVPLPHPARP